MRISLRIRRNGKEPGYKTRRRMVQVRPEAIRALLAWSDSRGQCSFSTGPPIYPASRLALPYWVIVTLIGVEPCRDPEDAVTMTLYVPAGVPPEFEDEPPHPTRLRIKANVVTISTAPTDEMAPPGDAIWRTVPPLGAPNLLGRDWTMGKAVPQGIRRAAARSPFGRRSW